MGYLVDPGQAFEVTLTVEGVYDYFCTPHEEAGMVGRIIVGRPSGPGARPVDDAAYARKGWRAVPPAAKAAFPSIDAILSKGIVRAYGPQAAAPRAEEAGPAETHGRFAIHVASVRDPAGVAAEWQRLVRLHPTLAGLEPQPAKVAEIPGKGRFYRVLGGAFATRAEAQAACARLQAEGSDAGRSRSEPGGQDARARGQGARGQPSAPASFTRSGLGSIHRPAPAAVLHRQDPRLLEPQALGVGDALAYRRTSGRPPSCPHQGRPRRDRSRRPAYL